MIGEGDERDWRGFDAAEVAEFDGLDALLDEVAAMAADDLRALREIHDADFDALGLWLDA
jgi:hypothetical protein